MAANDGFGFSINRRFACGFLAATAFTARAGLAFAQQLDPQEIVLLASIKPIMNYDASVQKPSYPTDVVAISNRSGLQLNTPIAHDIQLASLSVLTLGPEIQDIPSSERKEEFGSEHQGAALTAWISMRPLLPQADIRNRVAESYHSSADTAGHKGSALNLSPWSLQNETRTRWDRNSGDNLTYGGFTYGRPLADIPVTSVLPPGRESDIRQQALIKWQFSSIFQTSVGWESVPGGKPFAYGAINPDKANPKRLRATQSIVLGENTRLVLDITKTSIVVGPVKHATVGALRIVCSF